MNIVILDGYTTNPGDLDWKPLESLGQLTAYGFTTPEQVLERLRGADVAITNKVKLGPAEMDALPKLKYIGILATGMDCIDLPAARQRGITVTNVPVYANYSVSQLAIALMLEMCYSIEKHSRSVTEDKYWSSYPYNSYWLKPLVGLHGKTLGVVGMGRIGRQTASIGLAFGMKILAFDVFHSEIPGVEWTDVDTLLQESDFVSLHCPLTEETRGMINAESLRKMKKSACLINTSRGPLIKSTDLAEALNDGVIAGAALDVLEKEPPAADDPLLTAKNIIITPHIGWATLEARGTLISEVAENIAAFTRGEKRNVVN